MISVRELTYGYPGRPLLFELCTLQFEPGIHYLVGRNGSGKSTLLKLIVQSYLAQLGRKISLSPNSANISFEPYGQLAFLNQNFGHSLFPWFSVEQNLRIPLITLGCAAELGTLGDTLDRFGFAQTGVELKQKVSGLSGGQQQLLSIFQKLMSKPKVLILDEPFSALDDYNLGVVKRALSTYRQSHPDALILYTAHNFRQVRDLASHIWFFKRQGPQTQLQSYLNQPANWSLIDQLYELEILP